jgi:microcystin-dependent protein
MQIARGAGAVILTVKSDRMQMRGSKGGDPMSEPFLGQILLAGFGFAPKGYAACNGAILGINQNQALFALLGVTFGGNGSANFQLPDLRGRTPIGMGSSVDPAWQPGAVAWGRPVGTESVTLSEATMPSHTHAINVSTAPAATGTPTASVFAAASVPAYGPATGAVPLNGTPATSQGGSVPHENMQPFSVINMCIALNGYYPSRG